MTYFKLPRGSTKSSVRWYKRKRQFRIPRIKLRSKTHLIPHLFTLGNAFFGFCSIALAAHNQLTAAAFLILLGALMDALDGRVARYLGKTSDLGMQLDSLCDAISFCCAPALLMYFWQLKKIGFLGFLASAFFLLAGLLRLARFNLNHQQQSINFTGLPTTIAGCFLATLLLNMQTIIFKPTGSLIFAILVISLALLMICKITFPAFKKITRNTYALGCLIGLAFTIIMGLTKVLLAIFIAYFLCAFILALGFKKLP